ncbi:MAG: hypothetical protein KA538_00965 [Azonexus sp.]|jgi:hypothetical protein|nr:hypothetical protein [Azonexus sp.]
MHWLTLPEPRKNIELAFDDRPSAKAWLETLPQTQPMQLLAALALQVEAIDGGGLDAALTVELLNLLRRGSIIGQDAIEPRYVRKALPMQEEDESAFDLAQRFWLRLGVAYLRVVPDLPPADKALPLNRAACAFRMAEYCHFLAARECPQILDHLLFAVLAEAESYQLTAEPLADPDFRHLGDANIAGHLAWAFTLRLIDPYRLSAAQLAVANRAISRWRELAVFQPAPDDDPKAHSVDLAPLFGATLPADVPRWMEVRKVTRKIDQRITSLQEGESPEALKLGRELSSAACIRLLRDIDAHLDTFARQTSTEIGEIELCFGAENAYAVFTGELLNRADMDIGSATLAHQRVAMFGFDRISAMPTAVKKLNVPGENWTLVDGRALRPHDREGARRLSPCLIASAEQGVPRLGVMVGLQTTAGDALSSDLLWYEEAIEACRLAKPKGLEQQPTIPAFLLQDGDQLSMIVPATAGIRLFSSLALDGGSIDSVAPTEVLDRGVDFVRYAVKRQ